jgi:NAD+ kinase
MWIRYVENTLEHNHTFDAKSIIANDPSREGRLKYWNNELCAKHPLIFDFVVTVLYPQPPSTKPTNS